MKNMTPKATKMRKDLVKDPFCYVEAVGKQDNEALEAILDARDGKGTVMRLFLGATTRMPARSLTYVAAAARLMQRLPAEQLQIISVNTLGEAVNGTPQSESVPQFRTLARLGLHILRHSMPEVVEKMIFAYDTETPMIQDVRPLVEETLARDLNLRACLSRQGQKHGGDFVTYTAAHTVFQDTPHLILDPLGGTTAVVPERIVSIGCQKEKQFYAARMAVRELMDPSDLLPSLQIFTEHVAPPYFECIGGEQMLDDVAATRRVSMDAGSMSAQRDLRHFQDLLAPAEARHGQ